MKNKVRLLFLLLVLTGISCMEEPFGERASKNTFGNVNTIGGLNSTNPLINDHVKIAVVSDIHYMDPSLLQNGAANGEAFLNYLMRDPKLLEFSDPIFREVMGELLIEQPHILLIPGDLTKDGERVSHETMAQLLNNLASSGIKVYVIPGNHDINNPEARAYDGNNESVTPSISESDFASIYSQFGYANAIARDPNSLSYVAEPYPGLRILAIDANRYAENQNITIVGGKIKSATLSWIQDQMTLAAQTNCTVLGLMHHNLIEHYAGQNSLDPGYVIEDSESTADALMGMGLKVIFTGHYHANDVTERMSNGKALFDIETGSLVSPPSPYRIAILKNKELDVSTNKVTTIQANLPEGMSFPSYSYSFTSAYLDGYFGYALTHPPFVLSETQAASAAPLFRNAYMAHLAGDEKISPEEQRKDYALGQISPLAGMAVTTLWTDINTSDNKMHIKLDQ
jgi:3',5'-cyclic AMP phosphodiesterase CpdA